MRGDSLRDFYAKTLALIGLGLLGGIGALVDYWPASGEVPAVAANDMRVPVPAEPYLAADAMMPDFSARARGMAAFAQPVVPVAPAPGPAQAEVVPEALTVSAEAFAPDVLPSVALASAPMPDLFGVATFEPAPLAALPTMQVALSTPDMPESIPVDLRAPMGLPSVALSSADEDSGFLADATDIMKKTGSTIVNGTMKAGAPFVSMARFLGGAFRKITPFKD